MDNQLKDVRIFAKGIPHPEGIAIDSDGWLYTGSASPDHTGTGALYKVSPDGQEVMQFADTGGRVLGLAFDGSGLLYTCDVHNHAIFTVDRLGICNLFADRVGDRLLQKPNFLIIDPLGNLIVSDSGTAKAEEATGAVYRFAPNGTGQVLIDNLIFPNGIAFDSEQKNLLIVLTRDNSVIRVPINENGKAGEPILFACDLVSGPDGIAVGQNGDVYVTVTRPSQIVKFSSNGEKLNVILDNEDRFLAAPSNVAFGGVGQEILYIANLFGDHISFIKLRSKK